MPKVAYHLINPQKRSTSVVFASPHSGRDYSAGFLRRSVLDEHTIRSSEDAFVDKLFAAAPQHGAPLLLAGAPRAFVDLNRSADELDPALIEDVRAPGHNPRVASGLGVVPRVVAGARAIYRGKLTRAEAQNRIDTYWHPYHDALNRLLDEAQAQFGEAVLIDCHSMPHEAMDGIVRAGVRRPDVVLGDRFGASAGADVVDRIEAALATAGLKVVRNAPFAGAYTAQHYGRPSRRQHVVQIEIDRALYMNEQLIRPNGNFNHLQKVLSGVIAEITEMGRPHELPLAAE
ncbi:N-formylglutamate amidohydrolase [Lutimaribacter sp. EGI FJ00015]|uniref:N-formylglutamate amidohydrolase n=1 Tax=Lutimaribacter degradans TaxID=2945989 RepID=A0ACC5ZYW2_9RHOB|nr:N-formylglutamate amidohydrolase [Lutimaribacter sp. EGI FJ00013]MCM2562734.1 N-formylglutamate amidohydrolase [Lutimaribacter sp. EGI FJ00013]MCO0613891.1 N-formylglutamate amidohydrolase [Lutimaribacter sp. EGI FJ00015]MCO0636863.1 N-formylglutamate amidohydrolase [Lutimaribacter sp. EGI FJ00014]